MWRRVPITARRYVGDGDDFSVVVNGGLSSFDVSLRQSKSVSFAAERRTVGHQKAGRSPPKSVPSAAEERSVGCRREVRWLSSSGPGRWLSSSCPLAIVERAGSLAVVERSVRCCRAYCLLPSPSNFSGEYTILPHKVLLSTWLIPTCPSLDIRELTLGYTTLLCTLYFIVICSPR